MAKGFQLVNQAGKTLTPIPSAIPVHVAGSVMSRLIETHHEYKKLAAQEKTRREAINAWKDVRLADLKSQKEILRQYLEETFKERKQMIDGLFEALDKGIENNNPELINVAIGGIVNIASQSPLQQVDKLMFAMRNDDVKVIEF